FKEVADEDASVESAMTHTVSLHERRPLAITERVLIQDLGNDHQVVLKARDDAQEAFEKQRRKRAELVTALNELGPAQDTGILRQAIAKAQRQGDLDEVLDRERTTLAREEARAEINVATLGLAQGQLDRVECLAVPSVETIEQVQNDLDRAE